MFQKLLPLGFLVLLSLTSGCSSTPLNEGDPEALFQDAEADAKNKQYMQAAEKFRLIKNKFPYSSVAIKAALRLADVTFAEENYAEAAVNYENFRDLHPKHEQAPYVIFQIGESYFLQLPSTEDRDLTPGTKAIGAYEDLLKLYPNSTSAPQAKERIHATREKLAAKEKYIADFYYKQNFYDSARMRYEKIVKIYLGSSVEEAAYRRLILCLKKEDKLDEAKHVYETYLSRFPKAQDVDLDERKSL